MKTIFRSLAIVNLILLLSGCATSRPDSYSYGLFGYKYNAYRVQVITFPPGAPIYWNGDYVGKAPASFTVTGWGGIYPDDIPKIMPVTHVIKAVADGQRQYTQERSFKNPLPRTIYFDMYINPETTPKE